MRPKSLTASNSNTCRSVEPAESSFAFLKITGYIATYAPIEQTMSFIHTHIRLGFHRFSFNVFYKRSRDSSVACGTLQFISPNTKLKWYY